MMKPSGKILEVNGYPLKENWYEKIRWNTPEEDAAGLRQAWGAATKDRGTPCKRCRGRGYTRKDEGVGCQVCLGLGVINDD